MCSSSGGQNFITQPLVSSHLYVWWYQRLCKFISCLYMFRAQCAHHQEVKIVLHSIWYHHTYRCDDTRGCVMQFWPPDDEHMCSKHVEAWNKLSAKQKFCASSLLNTEIKWSDTFCLNAWCKPRKDDQIQNSKAGVLKFARATKFLGLQYGTCFI